MSAIKIGDISQEIRNLLEEYSSDVTEEVNAVVKKTAKNTAKEVREAGEYNDRTGDYRKSIKYDFTKTWRAATATIYASNGEYRLTHLLENGHVVRGGTGRKTEKFPHWSVAEENAIQRFNDEVLKKIKEVGK